MVSRWLPLLAVVALYVGAGKLSLLLALPSATFSPAWLPTGVAIGSMCIFGLRVLPAIPIGAALNMYTAWHSTGCSLGTGVGDTLEAVLGYFLIRHFIPRRNPLLRATDLFKFLIVGGLVPPIASATVGTLSCTLSGVYQWSHLHRMWIDWWSENANGVFVFAPLIISWGMEFPRHFDRKRALEAAALYFLLAATAIYVFGGIVHMPNKSYPLEGFCIPFLIWAAFRFGSIGVSSAVILMYVICVYSTQHGYGPFYQPSVQESLRLIQVFIGTNAVLSLALAAIVEERRQFEHHLIQSNEELDRFACLASHDLQEPLRTVTAFCQLIQKRNQGKLDKDSQEYLSLVVGAAGRMSLLITNLLDYSRLGKEIKQEIVDCGEVLDRALDNLRAAVTETGAEVHRQTLPMVYSDPALLLVLFQNLISNAIKFSSLGRPRVQISVRPEGDRWIFQVADNGVGIDPKHSQKIFELFERGGAHRQGGMGVGLAVCKKIVEQSGGKIWVESVVGSGSRFYFSLPRAIPAS